jgi:hypothetical protein
MNLVKRISVFALLIVTTVSMSALPLSVKAAGSYDAGSLLAQEGVSGAAVYYIGSDGMKYIYPDVKTYNTWYDNFDAVVRVDVAELDMYTDGGTVTYRQGTKLVTHENTAKIYAVEPGGVLRWIPTGEVAESLYGADWGAMVSDVLPGYFASSYSATGADLAATLPDGTVAVEDGGDTYYYITDGAKRAFASMDAFEANNFNMDYALTADLSGYGDGESITGEEIALSGYMAAEDDDDPVTPTDGDLNISLAAGTPAADNVPDGSPNDFVKFNFTTGVEAASVEQIKLSASGLGTSTYIDNVTFYDNGVKVGTSKSINSDREATFNFATPIEIAANSTKMLTVRATIEDGQTSGTFALGIESADDVVTGGTIGGSFGIIGNTMTVIDATIGTATLAGVEDDDISVNFGEDNVKLASFTIAAANEPLIWETARLRNGGTNNASVVSNFRVEIDGDVVVEEVALNGKYVDLDMGNYVIAKSDTVTVEVYGDIGVATVDNTVDLYIDNAADFVFMGQDYGYGVEIASIADLDAAGDGIAATLAAGDFTLDMDKSATPASDVKGGNDNVVLATISLTSNGEDSTVNYLTDSATVGDFYVYGTGLTTGEVENFELRNVDTGVIYDITETVSTSISAVSAGGWTLSMTDEMSLSLGETKTFELRVDLAGANDTYPIDDGDTLKVVLEDGAMNVTGDESDATISDITPSSVSSAMMTVRDGALTWTTIALTNKSVVGGAGTEDPVVIYKAGLEVGDSSDLTLSSVRLDADDTYYAAFKDDNIAQLDLYIVEGGESRLLKSTTNDIVNDGETTGYINFSSLNSTNRVLTAGVDVELEARAIFASSLPTTGTFALESIDTASYIVVRDSDQNGVTESIANATTDSRVMTLAAKGTLKAHLSVTDTKANDDMYILAGSESTHGRYLAELEFTTANEAIELTDLALEEYLDGTGADIKVVKLYDADGVVVAYKSPTAAGHVHFEADDFLNSANILPADETTSFFIGILTKTINADDDPEGTATFDHGVRFSFATSTALAAFSDLSTDEAVKARGVDSGEAITIIEDTNGTLAVGEYDLASVKSKTASTTGSILNVITNDMADGTLSGGTNKIVGEYKFVFDNGTNRTTENAELKAQLRELIVNIATSSGVLATNVKAYIEGDSGNKTDAAQPDANSEATLDLTTLDTETNLVDGEVVLIVVADLSVTGSDQYIQTEIDNLTTDFTYNGNDDDGTTYWVNARLDGITEVSGATLSN